VSTKTISKAINGSVSAIMGLMGWIGAGTTTLLYST
jgi:ABC-type multidrug transport system ATPase subunit